MGKYCASKQGRTHGKYQERLARRGLTKAPVMPDLRALRGRQLGSAEVELLDPLPTREHGKVVR